MSVSQLIQVKKPSEKRRAALILFLVVSISLALAILTLPQGSPSGSENQPLSLRSLAWLAQVAVSFMAVFASVSEFAGLSLRELLGAYTRSAQADNFPFSVTNNLDDLLARLYPNTEAQALDDKNIAYLPRLSRQLDQEFHEKGWILISGKSKTGKTREAVELLRRWWHSQPTILLANNFARFIPPFKVPVNLPTRNVVLFFDDIDRYCQDIQDVRNIFETISFFQSICRDPSELRVIATVRQVPLYFDKLHYKDLEQWGEFALVQLEPLSPQQTEAFIAQLAQANDMLVEAQVVEEITRKNDGTCLNIILSFREWKSRGISQVKVEHLAFFQGNLSHTWLFRYKELVKRNPQVKIIYPVIEFLQGLGIPLHKRFVNELSAEISLGPAYHWISGVFTRFDLAFELSPRLKRLRDPDNRHKFLLISWLLFVFLLYVASYLVFRFVSPRELADFADAILNDRWLVARILSPIYLLILLLLLGSVLRWVNGAVRVRLMRAIDALATTEIRMAGELLQPYEDQCEGKGDQARVAAFLPASAPGRSAGVLKRLIASKIGLMLVRWAEQLRLEGELDPAQTLAQQAQAYLPHHPRPVYILGSIAYDRGDLPAALQHFQHSSQLDRTASKAYALERCAWCHYRSGQVAAAEAFALESLKRMPRFANARWVLGLSRIKAGQVGAGLPELQLARQSSADLPKETEQAVQEMLVENRDQAWASQFSAALSAGDRKLQHPRSLLLPAINYLAAAGLVLLILWVTITIPDVLDRNLTTSDMQIRSANFMLRIYPNTPTWLMTRGYGYLGMGEYPLAIADFTRSIELLPDAGNYNNRGLAYTDSGEYGLARADFLESIFLDPEDWRGYANLWNVYEEQGSYQQAVADFTTIIQRFPDTPYGYKFRGAAYGEIGDVQQASQDFLTAFRFDPRADAYYAVWYYVCERGDSCAQAVDHLAEMIRLAPDDKEGYFYRGRAHSELGNYEQARQDFLTTIRMNPGDQSQHSILWREVYQNWGHSAQAVEDYSEIVLLAPGSPSGYEYRGKAQSQLGNFAAARDDLLTAIRLDPETATRSYDLWTSVYQQWGSPDQALTDFTEIIALSPSAAQPYLYRGLALCVQGESESAAADFIQAAGLFENKEDLYSPIWAFFEERQNYEQAVAVYTAIIRALPGEGGAYIYRGLAYSALGQPQLAAADYIASVRLNPQGFDVLINLLNVYQARGDYEQAVAEYSAIIQAYPESSLGYYYRGYMYYLLEENELALADYITAVRLNTGLLGPYYSFSWEYENQSEIEQVLQDYAAIIQAFPENPTFYLQRGFVYFHQEDYAAAIQDFTTTLELAPNDFVLSLRAMAYFELEDYARAIADLSLAIQYNPDEAGYYYSRGLAYKETGDFTRAAADFQQVLAMDPYKDLRDDAQQQLFELNSAP